MILRPLSWRARDQLTVVDWDMGVTTVRGQNVNIVISTTVTCYYSSVSKNVIIIIIDNETVACVYDQARDLEDFNRFASLVYNHLNTHMFMELTRT